MADPTDKPKPKFSSREDAAFWEAVYVASIRTMEPGANACFSADRALDRRQERMSDDLRDIEKPSNYEEG